MNDFYFLVNGPGEIAGWLYPLVKTLKRKSFNWIKDTNFYCVLVPCQFATGEEKKVVESFNFFKRIFTPEEYYGLFRRKKQGKTIVFHLGGDLFFNGILSKIWNAYSIAYIEKKYFWDFFFDKVYSSRFLSQKIKCVGDLRFENLNRNAFSVHSNKIALFPGSRDYALRFYLPFYMALIKEINRFYPNLSFTFFFSPFLRSEVINYYLKRLSPIMENLPIEIKILKDWEEDIKDILFSITLPGTTTIQLAYSGIPMLVILPLHRPEYLPLEGIAHFLKGKVRNKLVDFYLKKNPYLALPNRYKEGIVKEIVGKFNFQDVLKYLLDILNDRNVIYKMHKDLEETFPLMEINPSEVIWSDLNEILEKNF
ncbi:MAG: hypothetical protein CBR30_04035 [Dictyoglomus sp. NZ13-RE01]|nr:MAG: hypothetical protein CBR30_04035 [Dictyoglomus sp. NZ13-RE01]